MTEAKRNDSKDAPQGKVGVYICHCGGNISDHVDVDAVRDRAAELPGVAVARKAVELMTEAQADGQLRIAENQPPAMGAELGNPCHRRAQGTDL